MPDSGTVSDPKWVYTWYPDQDGKRYYIRDGFAVGSSYESVREDFKTVFVFNFELEEAKGGLRIQWMSDYPRGHIACSSSRRIEVFPTDMEMNEKHPKEEAGE